MKTIIWFFFIVFVWSCSPSYKAHRAGKLVNKAMRVSKPTVAQITRDSFPCITTASDTVSVISDSVVYIDCPQNNNNMEDYTGKDSMRTNTVLNKIIKVPVHLPIRTIRITERIEDSAKIYIAEKQSTDQVKQIDKLKIKSERRGKWNLYLIIGLLVSVLLNVIQFKRR